jgi:hypothetical protein
MIKFGNGHGIVLFWLKKSAANNSCVRALAKLAAAGVSSEPGSWCVGGGPGCSDGGLQWRWAGLQRRRADRFNINSDDRVCSALFSSRSSFRLQLLPLVDSLF